MPVIPANLSLPAGTAVLVRPDMVVFELLWQGNAGRYVVRLDQKLVGETIEERAESFAHAADLFRSAVGWEIISDVMRAFGCMPESPAGSSNSNRETEGATARQESTNPVFYID